MSAGTSFGLPKGRTPEQEEEARSWLNKRIAAIAHTPRLDPDAARRLTVLALREYLKDVEPSAGSEE